MRIASYNVNSIKARLQLLTSWLNHRNNDIDLLCLQETKTIDESFPKEAVKSLGFECAIFGQKAYNGVAICSKLPMSDIKFGFMDQSFDLQKRLISVKVNDINIINIYAPHGGLRGEEKFFYKLAWFERLSKFLHDNYNPDDKLIILGDFNVAHRDQDVYDPKGLYDTIATMKEERDAFQKVLDFRLIDCFRHINKGDEMFSWWSYLGGAIWNNHGMRIDYILAGHTILQRLKDIEIDLWPRRRRDITPSDHAPVVAEFEF